jgi:hypothetical protein
MSTPFAGEMEKKGNGYRQFASGGKRKSLASLPANVLRQSPYAAYNGHDSICLPETESEERKTVAETLQGLDDPLIIIWMPIVHCDPQTPAPPWLNGIQVDI